MTSANWGRPTPTRKLTWRWPTLAPRRCPLERGETAYASAVIVPRAKGAATNTSSSCPSEGRKQQQGKNTGCPFALHQSIATCPPTTQRPPSQRQFTNNSYSFIYRSPYPYSQSSTYPYSQSTSYPYSKPTTYPYSHSRSNHYSKSTTDRYSSAVSGMVHRCS